MTSRGGCSLNPMRFAARALAFAAAVAIDNAQLFERERTSVKWMEASREITTALLSSAEPHRRPLQLIAERACALTDAEQAIVLVPVDADLPVDEVDTLVVSAAVGLYASEVIGQRVPVDGSTSGAVFPLRRTADHRGVELPDSGIHRCRAAPRDRDAAARPR